MDYDVLVWGSCFVLVLFVVLFAFVGSVVGFCFWLVFVYCWSSVCV